MQQLTLKISWKLATISSCFNLSFNWSFWSEVNWLAIFVYLVLISSMFYVLDESPLFTNSIVCFLVGWLDKTQAKACASIATFSPLLDPLAALSCFENFQNKNMCFSSCNLESPNLSVIIIVKRSKPHFKRVLVF